MSTLAYRLRHDVGHPVRILVEPATDARNRLTTAFRPLLALPHLILVGGPIASVAWTASPGDRPRVEASAGVLGAVAWVAAVFGWFAILFTGQFPAGLRDLVAYYLRWRVRAIAYTALLRDEYPPFGDGPYPASLEITGPEAPRDRLTVALRLILAIPHLIIVSLLGIAWGVTTIIAWLVILVTGQYPTALYEFSVGVLRWTTRVEAYLLLLHDEYPSFSLE